MSNKIKIDGKWYEITEFQETKDDNIEVLSENDDDDQEKVEEEIKLEVEEEQKNDNLSHRAEPKIISLKKEKIKTDKSDQLIKKGMSLPLQYERNMDTLLLIEDFIENNNLWNIIDYNDPIEFDKNGGILLEDDEFKELKQMVFIFGQIMKDINDIDTKAIPKGKVIKPAQKIKSVIRISRLYL